MMVGDHQSVSDTQVEVNTCGSRPRIWTWLSRTMSTWSFCQEAKGRHEHGKGLKICHLSRRSWQVALRMSTTPSVLSCLHRMEVAMKQPVRPIPALQTKRWRKERERWIDQCIDLNWFDECQILPGEIRWLNIGRCDLYNILCVLMCLIRRHWFVMMPVLLTDIPAVHNRRTSGGRRFFPGSFYFLYQFQKRRSFVWSLLIGPRSVPVLAQAPLLIPTLVHTHTRETQIQSHWQAQIRSAHVCPICHLGVSCHDNNEHKAAKKGVRDIIKSLKSPLHIL